LKGTEKNGSQINPGGMSKKAKKRKSWWAGRRSCYSVGDHHPILMIKSWTGGLNPEGSSVIKKGAWTSRAPKSAKTRDQNLWESNMKDTASG